MSKKDYGRYGRSMRFLVATPPMMGLAHPAFTSLALALGFAVFFATMLTGEPAPVLTLMVTAGLQVLGVVLTRIDPDMPTVWMASLKTLKTAASKVLYVG